MDKFKGYLICTDCDGTLTDGEGKLSKENEEAIKYFQSEGGLFTLATGRFPEHLKLFENQFKINAPIVSLNGTLLYDTENEKVINTWGMSKDDCKEVLYYINTHWNTVWEYWINYENNGSTAYKPMDVPVNDPLLGKTIDDIPSQILKMVIIQPKEETLKIQKELKEKFGDRFRFDTSWAEGLEIQSIDSGKGVAVQYMKEHLNADIHTTIGVGDYENDMTLMECVDIGYAVENAVDNIKEAADRITVSNNEHAIAAIINELEKEI